MTILKANSLTCSRCCIIQIQNASPCKRPAILLQKPHSLITPLLQESDPLPEQKGVKMLYVPQNLNTFNQQDFSLLYGGGAPQTRFEAFGGVSQWQLSFQRWGSRTFTTPT